MSDRKYYVLCENNCKFESMTKEQILTAIEQAISTGEIDDVDTGFVTRIKEQNNGAGLTFWVGTSAEYNALDPKINNCFYIITDDTTTEDIEAAIENLKTRLEAVESKTNKTGVVLYERAPNGGAYIQAGDNLNIDISNYYVFAVTVAYSFAEATIVCGLEDLEHKFRLHGNIETYLGSEKVYFRFSISQAGDTCTVDAVECDTTADFTTASDARIERIIGIM